MDITVVLIYVFIFVLVKFLIDNSRKPSKFPKGPPRLPILGSIPFLRGKGVEKYVGEDIKRYGDVVGYYAGNSPVICLNDWNIAKQLFNQDIFCGRMQNYTTQFARSWGGENLGIVTTDGDRWSTQRTFCLKQLKNFGLSKQHLGQSILPQAKEVVQFLEDRGEVEMTSSVFNVPVLNVIWTMMAGETLERNDPVITDLLNRLNFIFVSPIFLVACFFPWIRFVFPSLTGYSKRLNVLRSIQKMLKGVIAEHKETLNENHPRDLIDAYLIEGATTNNPEFSTDQLVMICLDLMAAGSETTSTTLGWIVEYMALYPEVQEKCSREIEDVLGSADVSLEDSERLPYCMATIAEVQRVSAVAPSTIQHRLTQQYELDGYVLPTNALVVSNIQHFLSSPQLWNLPNLFNPDRFMNSSGEFAKPEFFVPLGHGKRVCMGESLVKAELIVFFVTLLQNLKFDVIPDKVPSPNNYSAGFTRMPSPFWVNITQR